MSRVYGVKLCGGPFVRLRPHAMACAREEDLVRIVERLPPGAPLAVDLFCGAGGLSLGLEQAGFRVILGVDSDEEALETHRSLCPGLSTNWDLGEEETIDEVARVVRDLKVTLLAGGPPCQPFSKAGRSMLRRLVAEGRGDARDHRSELWHSFLEVALRARPTAVIMENVPTMTGHSRHEFAAAILRELIDKALDAA